MITGRYSNINGNGKISPYDGPVQYVNPYTNPISSSNPLLVYYRFLKKDVNGNQLLNIVNGTYDAYFTYPYNNPTYPAVDYISTDPGTFVTDITGVPDVSGSLITSYINAPYAGSLGLQCRSHFVIPNSWTMSFWFKANSIVGGYLWQAYSYMTVSSSQIQYFDFKHTHAYNFSTGATPLMSNNMYHVAVSWSGSDLKVYINGVALVCTSNNNTGITEDVLIAYDGHTFESPTYGNSGNPYNLYIGSSDSPATNNVLGAGGGGYIDEFRFYQGVLTPTMIQNIYNKQY